MRPFSEVKIQWISLLSRDSDLTETARLVGIYIVSTHHNNRLGRAWPSYKTIATAIGRTTKTVQRAVDDLRARGWFDVVPGIGRKSSHYIPSEDSTQKANDLRARVDTVVHIAPPERGQPQPRERTKTGGESGHQSPLNLKTEHTEHRAGAREEQTSTSGTTSVEILESSFAARQWEKALDTCGIQPSILKRSNKQNLIVPTKFPSELGKTGSKEFITAFRNFISDMEEIEERWASSRQSQ